MPSGAALPVWCGTSRRATGSCSPSATPAERRSTVSSRRAGKAFDAAGYEGFLREIGYLLPEPDDFTVQTQNVDDEIARIAGPQLVVPVSNARYALNAANARWGSLYDALYGTDAIPEEDGAARSGGYNKARGAQVVARARELLDQAAPLVGGSHRDAQLCHRGRGAAVPLQDGSETAPRRSDPIRRLPGRGGQPVRRAPAPQRPARGDPDRPLDIRSARDDPAGVADLVVEAALSTIMDLEDSVAAVDADDKVLVYRTWLGLMKGDLAESFEKGGRTVERRLNPDRVYTAPNGGELRLHGRSLMLVRNVGHHMFTDAVLDEDGPGDPRDHSRRGRHVAHRHPRSEGRRARSATAAPARSTS